MAVFKSPPFGNLTGKIGDMVICRSPGGWYVRRKATQSGKPPSFRQCVQRKRLAATVLFYKAIKDAGLRGIWRAATADKKMSGFNLFIQANIRNFSEEGTILDFAKICLSTGLLELPDQLKVCARTSHSVSLSWEVRGYLFPEGDDDRLVVALMENKADYTITVPAKGAICRKDGKATILLPPEADEYHHLYVFFQTDTGGEFSETRYFEI